MSYEDLARRRLVGDDLELLKLAVQLGLRSFAAGVGGASFAPCLLLWPSKVVVATTSMMMVENASVEACVEYLRAAVPISEDLEAFAIVADARTRSPEGEAEDSISIELASGNGGYRVAQKHTAGRALGGPEVYALFDSPLLTRPTEAQLELAEEAFATAEDEPTLPFALVADTEPTTLLRLEEGDGDGGDPLFALAEHVFESFEPCLYAMVWQRAEGDQVRTRVEVGEGRGRAFVLESTAGDAGPLRLVSRSPALWKKLADLRAHEAAARPPCRTK